MGVRSFGMTHRGLVRDANEDQFLIATLSTALGIQQSSLPQARTQYGAAMGQIFLVADGVGGCRAGQEASALAVMSIEDFLVNTLSCFFQLKRFEKEIVSQEIRQALRLADDRIFREIARHPELSGMATTMTLAFSVGAHLFVANAGDSRGYLFRDGVLLQLTHDHTLTQDLIRQGMNLLTQSDRFLHGDKVTNAIGGQSPGLRVDVHKATIKSGDVLLLSTDGLTRYVPDERIRATLLGDPQPKRACEQLVAQSLEQGGRDNVTVIVARYDISAP